MDTRTQIDPPSLPLLRRASTLIAMGTVGLALAVAGPASAEDTKPVAPKKKVTTDTITSPPPTRALRDILPMSTGVPVKI